MQVEKLKLYSKQPFVERFVPKKIRLAEQKLIEEKNSPSERGF